jgi:hypothetical protein
LQILIIIITVGGGLAEVGLIILLGIKGRNTPKLTTKVGKYMQNYLRAQ